MKRILLVIALLAFGGAARAQTPCPSGKTCGGGVTFTVTFQAPGAPASVSPAQVVAGAAATTVTLAAQSGSSFNSTMVVEACQATPAVCTTATDLATTFVSATSMTAVIPASLLTSSGTITIYISQPNAAHAANVFWGAPAVDATHSAATAYNVKRSAVSLGPTQPWAQRAA
jgi:hypothetical protein